MGDEGDTPITGLNLGSGDESGDSPQDKAGKDTQAQTKTKTEAGASSFGAVSRKTANRPPEQKTSTAQTQPDPATTLIVDKGASEEASKLNYRSREVVNSLNATLNKLINAIKHKDESLAELQLELVEHKVKRLEAINNQIIEMAKGTSGIRYMAETEHYLDELIAAKHKFRKELRSVKKEEKGDTPYDEQQHKCVTQRESNMLPKMELKKFSGNHKDWRKW